MIDTIKMTACATLQHAHTTTFEWIKIESNSENCAHDSIKYTYNIGIST